MSSPFAYCANNPIIFVDPDGQEIFTGARGLNVKKGKNPITFYGRHQFTVALPDNPDDPVTYPNELQNLVPIGRVNSGFNVNSNSFNESLLEYSGEKLPGKFNYYDAKHQLRID